MTALIFPDSTSWLMKARSFALALADLRPVAANDTFFLPALDVHNLWSKASSVGFIFQLFKEFGRENFRTAPVA